jgi:hypothetical protein
MNKIQNILILLILSVKLNAQNSPSYPQPKEGFKRVDLLLPKIENSKDYKIQVKFSIEATVGECSNASFSFNRKNLKEEYYTKGVILTTKSSKTNRVVFKCDRGGMYTPVKQSTRN